MEDPFLKKSAHRVPEVLANVEEVSDTGRPTVQYRLYKRRFSGIVALVRRDCPHIPTIFKTVNNRYS